jgi:membrane-associated phospholipid phosphatase/tRNA A-37 threonylcarbamoyl transferase component Bud32
MDGSSGHALPAARDVTPPVGRRGRRRRRPTGEPPPLPRHLESTGVGWMVAAAGLIALTLLVFTAGRYGRGVSFAVVDNWVVEQLAAVRTPWLTSLMRGVSGLLGSVWTVKVLAWGTLIVLVVYKRFRQLIVGLVSVQLTALLAIALSAAVRRPRPFGVVIEASWTGWSMPSRPVAYLSAIGVGMLYSLVPKGRWRQAGKWIVTALVALLAFARMYLGAATPTDVLVGAALGVTIPLLAFRWFAPNDVFPVSYHRGRTAHLDVGGARGAAIRRALSDQLGLEIEDVKPFGLSGSAGSTPLRIKVKGNPPRQLFGKLYAQSHLRSDRWYKLGRELLYGRLEDEKPFHSVRRLVQQEDYALHKLHLAGLPSPAPFGFVELTPEREYLLVTEFFEGAVELGEAEVDDQLINDGLKIIRKLWDAGLAHRDIKPANLLVRDGRLLLIDVAFVQARPSPWRQAVDLANMMLCLALRSSSERVYERALRQFSVEEITEGFAAARGLALPSQLRHMLRDQGRDLHAEFIRLLPTPPQPVSIQRWTIRRVGLLTATVVLTVLLVSFLVSTTTNTDSATKTSLEIPSLDCTDLEPLWLQAQAVPSASLVPCVRPLPAGWSLAKVAVNDGRSVITLDHDRTGGQAMEARLTAACDVGQAAEEASGQPGVRRYQRVERQGPDYSAVRFDVFPGGCVTTRVRALLSSRAEVTGAVPGILGYTSRQALAQALEQRSGGRLHLDP